jgi:hypothetical protein
VKPNYLFQKSSISNVLDVQSAQCRQKVDAIAKDQFLATPVDDLVEFVVAQMTVQPLVIYEDRMSRDQQEINIDVAGWPGRYTRGDGPCLVAGIRVVVALPYTGEEGLWDIRPNTFSSMFPFGSVRPAVVEMIFECPIDQSLETIKRRLDENIRSIKQYLGWQEASIKDFNRNLPSSVRSAIEARRKRLEKHDQLAGLLNIPLHHNPNAPEFRSINVQRRIVKPLPPVPTGGLKQEWTIDETEYENILTIIRHEGRTFEATPKTYAVHEEEELRDIMLAHLNGHYKGDASGETFRRSGKTDLRIEAESRTAFVAECKVWKGSQVIHESIDQLLGYLTWRDCKTALVVFNKHVAGFSDILDKTQPMLESHPRFMKTAAAMSDIGEWRTIFRAKEDASRLIHVHLFLFNLYFESAKPKSKPRKA